MLVRGGPDRVPTRGPSWGHPMVVLGASRSFLEPFCGHLLPTIDKFSEDFTLRYPHEGSCVRASHVAAARFSHRELQLGSTGNLCRDL
jgi:hypothetical protein